MSVACVLTNRRLFIMDGIISAPIAIAGLFLIPDLPENSRAFYLRKDQIELAKKRMDDVGRAPRKKLGWSAWKRIFGRWHVYLLTILYIIFINTVSVPHRLLITLLTPSGTFFEHQSDVLMVEELWLFCRAHQHHTNHTVGCASSIDCYSRHLLGLLPPSCCIDVCVDLLRSLLCRHPRDMECAEWSEVVRVRDLSSVGAIWPDQYVVGEVSGAFEVKSELC